MNPKRFRKIALYLKYLAHLIEEETKCPPEGNPADETPWRELTPEQAQAAYDAAPAVPLSEERIQEIVSYATQQSPARPRKRRLD